MLSSELKYEVFAIALCEDSPSTNPSSVEASLPSFCHFVPGGQNGLLHTVCKGVPPTLGVSPFPRCASVCTCLAHPFRILGGLSQLHPSLLPNLRLGSFTRWSKRWSQQAYMEMARSAFPPWSSHLDGVVLRHAWGCFKK